jgi:hypothetical protein
VRGKRQQLLGLGSTATAAKGPETQGLRLLNLMLRCAEAEVEAEAVAMDLLTEAGELLPKIAELALPFRSSPELSISGGYERMWEVFNMKSRDNT